MVQQENHQVVNKEKKKRRMMIAAICIAAMIVGVIFVVKKSPKKELTYAYIRTTTLAKGSLEDSISTTGTIESAEVSNVTTDLNYPVVSVKVAVGDQVKAGDVLCILDTSDLENQIEREKKNLLKNQTAAQSSYDDAEENYETARENADDSKQALADAEKQKSEMYSPYKTALKAIKTYQSEYDNALAAYEKAGAKYVSATKNYKNAVSQYKKEKLTEDELVTNAKAFMKAAQNYYGNCSIGVYDISESSSASARNEISVSESANDICDNVVTQVKNLTGKTISYSDGTNTLYKLSKKAASLRDAKLQCNYDSLESAYSVAENTYKLAEQEYNQCKEAVSQAKKQLEQAKEQLLEVESSDTLEDLENQLDACEIKANQDGTITALNVAVGSSVNAMNAVATISSMENLKVSITIAEADINRAEIGMTCHITSDASDEILNGTLTQIDPVASDGGSFHAEVTVDSATEILHIGMNASAEIVVSATENVYQVPIDAVGNDGDDKGDYVYRQSGGEGIDMTFEKVYVTTGEKNDYYIEVSADGLKEGDVIRATADLTAGIETSDTDDNTTFNFPFGGNGMPEGDGQRGDRHQHGEDFDKGDSPSGGNGPAGNPSGGGTK